MVARLSMLLIFLAALYLATFAKPAMILFGGIVYFYCISVFYYFVRSIVVSLDNKRSSNYGGNLWFYCCDINRNFRAANYRQSIALGRWPLTIHSGVWGLLFNVLCVFLFPLFILLTKRCLQNSSSKIP